MRVLFLSNSIGGLKSFRMELIQKLLDTGNQVGICSPLEIEPDMFKRIGCEIFPIDMSRHGKNPIQELSTLRLYKKTMQQFLPNVCLAYTIKPNIYGSIACHKIGVPIIASVTGLGAAVENGGMMQHLTICLMKYGMKHSDHVYFQNQESFDFFNEHGINLKSASLIAGSGVNLDRFYMSDYPESEDEINFLYTGRILEAKGVGLYLEAARVLKRKYPKVRFHIVGIKDDVKYSRMVDDYEAEGTIIFHGYQKDPREFIRMSHCQVHPTYYPEGMSNVLLESAAMGRPAITTDRSGCKEIVDDGITGFIIPQRDGEALIKAIEKFINLPHADKIRMGMAAHEKVATHFDRMNVVNEYIRKMKELTES